MEAQGAIPLCGDTAGVTDGRARPVDGQRVGDERTIPKPRKLIIGHVRAGEIAATRLLIFKNHLLAASVHAVIDVDLRNVSFSVLHNDHAPDIEARQGNAQPTVAHGEG